MARPSEEISKATANSNGKTDANLANDSNHLGGIAAEEYATKQYVQEYHNSQTEELTETMNRNDNTVLQQAKGYTDAVVGNQDFSGFAKQTDIQTLNTNLTNQINQCKNNCETKINNKASQIVQDVNANFDDVNAAINQLRATDNQLFQSVSNGKSLIAGAITDKGVSTSASDSFSTMANKITQIPTSSGGGGDSDYDENYVNTEDATATADDILLGKTAYVKGERLWGNHKDLDTRDATANPEDIMYGKSAYMNGIKVYGTYIPLNTSDATASESDILQGETAYVNGQKITGTYVPGISPDDPDVVDTSDATAIANDLIAGKTAYARGEKITGTYVPTIDTSDATATPYDILTGKAAYTQNGKITGLLSIDQSTGQPSYDIGSVEKIYGTVADKVEAATRGINSIFNISSETIYCFGYNSRFTGIDQFKVMASSNGGSLLISSIANGYVESTDEDGILKTQYSTEDLGFETNERIVDMAISDLASGYPYMAILAGKTDAMGLITTVNLYLFHIEYDNKIYTLDTINKTKRTISAISSTRRFCFRDSTTYYVGRRRTLTISADGTKICLRPCVTQSSSGQTDFSGYYIFYEVFPNTLQTDNIASLTYPYLGIKNRFSFPGYFYNNFFICEGVIISINSDTRSCNYYTISKCKHISKDLTFCITLNDDDSALCYQPITVNADKTLTFGEKVLISESIIENYLYPIGEYNVLDFYSSTKTKAYSINNLSITDLYDLEVNGATSPEITILGDSLIITKKTSYINIYTMFADFSKIVGLRYDGNLYFKQNTTILTATPSDVVQGKTFISSNGSMLTGTRTT